MGGGKMGLSSRNFAASEISGTQGGEESASSVTLGPGSPLARRPG